MHIQLAPWFKHLLGALHQAKRAQFIFYRNLA
jgi:hypothetical protein